MAASLQPPSAGGPAAGAIQPEAAAAAGRSLFKRVALIVLAVAVLFAGAYALAWYNAYRLSARFGRDADAAYAQGDYLQALVGGEKFDPQTNRNVKIGGYLNVEKVWSSGTSWPEPSIVTRARERSQEIINQRLTIPMAEQYIRANTGRPAPYFAEIYLRLGELYEQDGDLVSARDIYESISELFPNRPDLIEQAKAHLAALPAGK
jgi:hypothetical protein